MHTNPLFRILASIAWFFLLAPCAANAQGQQQYDDPGQLGRYAVGHISYQMVDKDANNRPEFFSVWYPVDPKNIDSSTHPAEYLTDPYTGTENMPATFPGAPSRSRRPRPLSPNRSEEHTSELQSL